MQLNPPVNIEVRTAIEFSKDEGKTWAEWTVWQPGPTYNPPDPQLLRMQRLYPEWQFRKVTKS